MQTRYQIEKRRLEAIEIFSRASIVLTEQETQQIEIADFALGEFEATGLGVGLREYRSLLRKGIVDVAESDLPRTSHHKKTYTGNSGKWDRVCHLRFS